MLHDPKAVEPTLRNFLGCKPFKIDIYLKKLDRTRLQVAPSEQEYTSLLYEIFREKDHLMAHYHQYAEFPHELVQVKPISWFRVLRFLALNLGLSGSLIGYIVYLAAVSHNLYLRLVIYSIIALVSFGLLRIYARLKNSSYGSSGSRK